MVVYNAHTPIGRLDCAESVRWNLSSTTQCSRAYADYTDIHNDTAERHCWALQNTWSPRVISYLQ